VAFNLCPSNTLIKFITQRVVDIELSADIAVIASTNIEVIARTELVHALIRMLSVSVAAHTPPRPTFSAGYISPRPLSKPQRDITSTLRKPATGCTRITTKSNNKFQASLLVLSTLSTS